MADSFDIFVGVPEPVGRRIIHHFRGRGVVRVVQLGGPAAVHLRRFIDEAKYSGVTARLWITPYEPLSAEMARALAEARSCGFAVVELAPSTPGLPATSRKLQWNKTNQDALERVLIQVANEAGAGEEADAASSERDPTARMLKLLHSHNKLGQNNHSAESELFKGENMSSSEKRQIIRDLEVQGILASKPNKSRGGTGNVYWIADLALATTEYPEFGEYVRARSGR
jgi:hypothetical protein